MTKDWKYYKDGPIKLEVSFKEKSITLEERRKGWTSAEPFDDEHWSTAA
jgi:hypothetical protein